MSKRSMDFDVLLQAYSQNPASVIEEIIRSTYHFTLSLALLILQDFEDALVTTQAVYQQAFINLDAYPTGTNFEGWIAALTIKVCKKKRRSQKMQAIFGKQFRRGESRSGLKGRPAARPPDKGRDGKILAAVYELPEDLRLPAFFHFSQRFSQSEIAQILHTSEEKINRRVASAVEALTLSGRSQDLAPIETVLANPLRGLVDSQPPQPDLEREIEALIQDFSLPGGRARSDKLWRKHGKEAGWTLMVISLVLMVGWVFSRRPPEARLEPRLLSSATPLPSPLMVERNFLFLEEDQAGNGSQSVVEPEGSWEPVVSADGRWVVFSSSVSNLVEGDQNAKVDIFIYDRENKKIDRVSVASDGQEADRNSFQPGVSGDGRYVVFTSTATNLDPRDNQICGEINTDYNCFDVFLRDRGTGETRMISVTSAGEPADNLSVGPAISADGEWVAYWSMADNLVPGDSEICGTGEFPYNCVDIFLHSLRHGTTERIRVGRALGEGETPFPPLQLSADGGRLLTMLRRTDQISPTINLENEEDIFVFDRETDSWTSANLGQDQQSGNAPARTASLSGDGRYVAFASAATNLVPSDVNSHVDVFLRNLENGYTERISEVRSGGESDGDSGAIEAGLQQDWIIESLQISQDARWLLFISKASNLSRDVIFDCSSNPSLPGESYLFCYHLFLHDRLTRITRHIYGPLYHFTPYASLSGDGRWVTFLADTTECYSRGFCTDIFLYDRLDQSLQALRVASADEVPFIPSLSDFPRWSFVNVFQGHQGWVTGLAFTPDNTRLASVRCSIAPCACGRSSLGILHCS